MATLAEQSKPQEYLRGENFLCISVFAGLCPRWEMCGGAAGERNWTFRGFGFLSVELHIFFFLFKATNPALGCLPINQEYFFISAKLSLMLSCWWHMRLARAGTLLRVLTPLSSIPRNSYRFSIGPRTDQCLLYINTVLTIENCLIYFSPPLVNWWCRSSSWLTADFSAMICSSAHANDVRLFSEIGRLYHIFLGFTHDHFFPVVAEWWVLKAQYRLTGCWV